MFEQAPQYIPDDELTPEQLEVRKIAKAEAATAAQSNANLTFNPETGSMEPADKVLADMEAHQGEQA